MERLCDVYKKDVRVEEMSKREGCNRLTFCADTKRLRGIKGLRGHQITRVRREGEFSSMSINVHYHRKTSRSRGYINMLINQFICIKICIIKLIYTISLTRIPDVLMRALSLS